MRLRNVPGAREVMIENEYVFTEPEGISVTIIQSVLRLVWVKAHL